jgi:hypothetical protein
MSKYETTIIYSNRFFRAVKTVLIAFGAAACSLVCAEPAYELTAKTLTAPSTEAVKQFSLTCDRAWTLSSKQNWLNITPKSGTAGTYTISVEVKANPGKAERNGLISFSAEGIRSGIPVSQVDESNYWKDGELIPLHQSANLPEGRLPIPVVIIGDGWDLSDLKKGGLWETFSRALSNLFLNIDVVKDFENYFDIYAYCAESNQRGKYGFNAFGTTPVVGTDFEKMRTRILEAIKDHPNKQALRFMSASNGAVGGWASVEGYAFVSTPDSEGGYAYWMAHEFVGHGFAQLPDFYPCWDCEETFTCKTINRSGEQEKDDITRRGGTFPKCYTNGDCNVRDFVKRTYAAWDKGFEWNIDWETDPKKVVWKDFIGKPGYNNVGVFATEFNDWGEYDSWFYGLSAPEEDDCMETTNYIWFSVGSRIWLWNVILQMSGVSDPNLMAENPDPKHPRSIENFIKFDAEHHYNNNGIHNDRPVEHPVLRAKYWKENRLYPEYSNWIAAADITVEKQVPYTGKNSVPPVTVTLYGDTLKAGTDYTLKYADNKKPGDASVVVKGKGKYLGYRTETFKIVDALPQ